MRQDAKFVRWIELKPDQKPEDLKPKNPGFLYCWEADTRKVALIEASLHSHAAERYAEIRLLNQDPVCDPTGIHILDHTGAIFSVQVTWVHAPRYVSIGLWCKRVRRELHEG